MPSVLDRVRGALTSDPDDTPGTGPLAVPPRVQKRITRGRADMKRDAAKRRLCMRFERGDTYWFLNNKGVLSLQNTVTNPNGSGKPPHRIRNTYNYLRPLLQGKVSTATQKTPSYEVLPSTTDQARVGAAKLAEKVALYGRDKWGIQSMRVRAANYAIAGGGEGFAWPYWEPNVGPYTPEIDPLTGEPELDPVTGMPEYTGQGDVRVLVLNGNEVYWEPGCLFEESPWWCVERAVPIDVVKDLEGYLGGELSPDAASSDIPNDRTPSDQMVMLTDYLERPCPGYPNGRHLKMAGGKVICPPADYPLKDAQGQVLDEPVLHRLAWDIESDTRRDFGLTWQLIDFERTVQDCWNKLLEYKNRGLIPQMMAPEGSQVTRRTDQPGAVNYYKVIGNGAVKPEWENPIEVPQALFQILDVAKNDMRTIAFDDMSAISSLGHVAASTFQAALQQSMNRWAAFMARLAEWDSDVMRHCLYLVARFYTEPRLLEVKGRDGWEHIADFQGSDLLGETSVRVEASALTPTSRKDVQDQLTWLAQTFPGFLDPQSALAAMQSGSLDRLTDSYWLDVARINTIIQKIRDGSVLTMPAMQMMDPVTGDPVPGPDGQPAMVPSYMPNVTDNLKIWRSVLGDWMKTDDYAGLPSDLQDIGKGIWAGIDHLEIAAAQRQQQLQTAMAEQQGMMNAARPQGATPMPSLPGSQGVPPPKP